MKILAVDTASKSCSVAVVDNTSVLALQTIISDQTHSRHLMVMIDKVINLSHIKPSDIDGFAVTTGPGTFTGLRIGISSVKGLAVALNKPVTCVSSLDVLAMQTACYSYLICPMMDARRGEVYCAHYRLTGCGFKTGMLTKETDEKVFSPDKALENIHEPCMFVGEGASLYHKIIEDKLGGMAFFASPNQNTTCASTVAYLGLNQFKNNVFSHPEAIAPHYIRRSDAEMNAGA
jgi:tRNA threonylcarbamoyladenosine biosynthesis protein TsaB